MEQAPQEGIAALHAARFGREGLVQRSRIRDEVAAWMSDPSRLPAILSRLPAAESVAIAVHLAGPEGIPAERFAQAQESVLDELASEFAIVLGSGDGDRWCPLTDLTAALLEGWSASFPSHPRPRGRRTAARAFLEGVAALSAAIDSGKARLNRDGSPNRRDRPALREAFSHLASLGEAAQERAVDLAFELLAARSLLVQRDGRLETSAGMEDWLAECDADPLLAVRWWIRRDPSLGGIESILSPFSEAGLPGSACAELFLRRSGSLAAPPESARWNLLPEGLRAATVVGLVETESVDDEIVHAWPCAPDAPSRAERDWWCTSDFLLYLAPDAPLRLHRAAAFMGERESSDLVSRYRLVRDSILAGAANPTWGRLLPSLLESLAPPRSVEFQLEEWLASRRACIFESVRVLRVPDPRRHAELQSLDQFRSLVRETIPGWGFVVDPEGEPVLRRLLSTLGYDPPADPSEAVGEPWSPVAPAPCEEPALASWQWPRIGAAPRRGSPGSGSRYAAGAPRELDFPDLLRLLEYAALTEAEVDVVLKGQSQRTVRFRVARVDRRKEPASVEARLSSTGERRDLPLETIRRIALAEN